MGLQDAGDWCVLLVTRESARIFRGGPSAIREVRDLRSDVTNQHSAGGWSQARYERSVEREVEWHLEAATDLLFRQYRRRPFAHLVIGANNESLRPALSGELHPYLIERIRGWVDIDERLAGPEEVLEAVRGVMDAHLALTERELLERFAAERARDGRAAEGVEAVLPALVEQKVETLLVREGAQAPGVKCVTCGWMGPAGVERCPVDDTALDAVENIVEPAIQSALQQSATVHVVPGAVRRGRATPRAGRRVAAVLKRSVEAEPRVTAMTAAATGSPPRVRRSVWTRPPASASKPPSSARRTRRASAPISTPPPACRRAPTPATWTATSTASSAMGARLRTSSACATRTAARARRPPTSGTSDPLPGRRARPWRGRLRRAADAAPPAP